jgi:hypothetical protein
MLETAPGVFTKGLGPLGSLTSLANLEQASVVLIASMWATATLRFAAQLLFADEASDCGQSKSGAERYEADGAASPAASLFACTLPWQTRPRLSSALTAAVSSTTSSASAPLAGATGSESSGSKRMFT